MLHDHTCPPDCPLRFADHRLETVVLTIDRILDGRIELAGLRHARDAAAVALEALREGHPSAA